MVIKGIIPSRQSGDWWSSISGLCGKRLKIRRPLLAYWHFFFKIVFIYSWEAQRERQRHRQREKQALCWDPDARFNPRTPGSRPEPKADAHPLSHPGAPDFDNSKYLIESESYNPSPFYIWLFYLMQYFQGSPVLWYVPILHFILWVNNVPS